ncbi:MAG: DUF4148 domain-containing protein [Nitrospirae bacterium]|nr:DUF4148 domain-containing protein [Nitrospirota bacterium]
MMKAVIFKLISLIVLVACASANAAETAPVAPPMPHAALMRAHDAAVKAFKADRDAGQAVKLLEDASVKAILDTRPEDIPDQKYVNILNDYAFFLSETAERLEEAEPVLNRVIGMSPDRTPAYLNRGDLLMKIFGKRGDIGSKKKAKADYLMYRELVQAKKPDARLPDRVRELAEWKTPEQAAEEEEMFRISGRIHFRAAKCDGCENLYDKKFCNEFLNDFQSRKGIEFIYPFLNTDDWNDPRLRTFTGRCPDLELNKVLTWEPRISEFTRNLPPKEREEYAQKYYASYGFRLYRADFDNNVGNGIELSFPRFFVFQGLSIMLPFFPDFAS